jgi:hypothetical protein
MRPPLQWTIDPILSDGLDERYATYHADFGRGRYSVASVSGFLTPWYGARWHRSRRASDRGENITGAPTLKAAKAACERHAASRAEQG